MDYIWIILLAFLLSTLGGYYAGHVIGKYARKEVKQGKRYIEAFKVFLIIVLAFAVFQYTGKKDSDSLVIVLSVLFLAFMTIGSLYHVKKQG